MGVVGGRAISSEEGVREYTKQSSLIRQENGKKKTMQQFRQQGVRINIYSRISQPEHY